MYDINWKIGGVGGMGAMGVGLMFSKIMFRSGFCIVDCNEYNSIIKGGHNNYQVRCSSEKVYSVSKNIDILIALDEFSLTLYKDLSSNQSYIICDWALFKNKVTNFDESKVIDVPFSMLNKANGGDEIMKNMIGLGASLALLKSDINVAKEMVKEQFQKKGEEVIDKNNLLIEVGFNYVVEHFADKIESFTKEHGIFSHIQRNNSENSVATGNEATALSSIASGMGYYAAYPMTPASSIIHYLAPLASKYNFVVKQAEDEISAVNSAIGASWGGARAMTATSGGGFSLMVEGLGLAAMTETPIVMVLVSRPGPSTGMPTWTDQGDLRFALHSSQGEFLRILLTPGDPQECFEMTNLAFVLSEKYHIPAIVLYDKYLAEGHWSCQISQNSLDTKRYGFVNQAALERMTSYERYADTPSGVTPRSIPGYKNGIHLANSDEHDSYGLTSEESDVRNIQLNKRYTKKSKRIESEMPLLSIYGDQNAKIGIISFGSTKNPILEAMKKLPNVKYIHIKYVSPFPKTQIKDFINSVNKFIVIENNFTGQLAGLITENTGIETPYKLLKDDGRPFYYEEIIDYVNKNGN